VVAVASAPAGEYSAARGRARLWTAAAVAVLVVGLVARLVVGGGGVGDRSAMVMTVLFAVAAWLAARLLAGPRAALAALAVVVVLLDMAALPPRNPPEYDDLEALYRTDQQLTLQLTVPAAQDLGLTVLAQPVFSGQQAPFGLAADVDGSSLAWTCPFQRGVQRLALPVPRGALEANVANVQLHLSGTPSRESDYLVVYASSKLGGFVIELQPLISLSPDVTRCALA
jgi:hypothetical protein